MKKIYLGITVIMLTAGLALMAEESFTELCKSGKPAQIAKALKKGASVKVNEYGISPLMLAAGNNPDPEVINLFLKNGALINETDPTGTTPLMYAALQNNAAVVEALLKAGADAKLKNSDGKTAYELAEFNEKINRTPVYQALKDAIDKQ